MRPLAGSPALAALLLASAIAEASSLVLIDEIIKRTKIKRQGDAYLVTMAGGNTVAFPVALVKELKFEGAFPPKAPPGFDDSGQKTLDLVEERDQHEVDTDGRLGVQAALVPGAFAVSRIRAISRRHRARRGGGVSGKRDTVASHAG